MAYRGKRDDSSVEQFRMRVPEAVKDRVRGKRLLIWLPEERGKEPVPVTTTIGTEVKFSLRTRDPATAEHRRLAAQTHLQQIFYAAEKGPVRLSRKNLVALSKGVYDLFIEIHHEDPGSANRWVAFKAFTRAAVEGRITDAPPVVPGEEADIDEAELALEVFGQSLTAGINAFPKSDSTDALEQRFGLMTDWLLAKNGIEVDAATRTTLLRLVGMAALDAGWQLKRNANDDYSPDPAIARYPAFEPVDRKTGVKILDLFDGWARERMPSQKTVAEWRKHVQAFITFAKEDDAMRIKRATVVAWKDALFEAGGSPKTINDSKLAALRKVFAWGKDNERIASNPAEGVAVDYTRRMSDDMKGFSDEEAKTILAAAAQETGRPSIHWIPLLCATSGARVGEIAQLRGEDIFERGGMLVMRITNEAGSLKNRNSVRILPIHPAVIEAGFLAFVGDKKGPLFFGDRRRKPDAKKPPHKIVAKNVAEWVRSLGLEIGREHRKDSNHAWRHRFTTLCREYDVADSVIDLIKGSAPASVSRGYGTATLTTMARAIQRIPVPDEVVEAYRNGERSAVAAPSIDEPPAALAG